MRLGGPLPRNLAGPEAWVAAARARGYRAVGCPLEPGVDLATIRAYREAAQAADLVIAEVGVWNNPLGADSAERATAIEKCKQALLLAEQIGARCCVNISGSRGARWDGPDPRNLTEETFDLIVTTVREIIDAIQPRETCYTLEPMPWMYPDSADSYKRLIAAIDRPGFAVHFDPVNMINSPERFFNSATMIHDFVVQLGPQIRACHIKDITLAERLTVHLDEVRPGAGQLDYARLLGDLATLGPDMPVMLEHLPSEEEYTLAAEFVRRVAAQHGYTL